MTKQTSRILVVLSVILLLMPGCSMDRISRKPNDAPIVVRELVKTTRSWDGNVLPAHPQGQPEVTILRIGIPAGSRLETHFHPVINAGVLLKGELTVVSADGKTLHLKAGDPIVEVVNTLHYGVNQGNVPAEIIVFYTGVVDTPITVIPQKQDQGTRKLK